MMINANYLPLKFALRFSTKAFAPSLKSLDLLVLPNSTTSRKKPASPPGSKKALTHSMIRTRLIHTSTCSTALCSLHTYLVIIVRNSAYIILAGANLTMIYLFALNTFCNCTLKGYRICTACRLNCDVSSKNRFILIY